MVQRPMSDRRWTAALDEHERAVREFRSVVERIPIEQWHRRRTSNAWSPADVTLHVVKAYEIGRDAAAGGPGMRLRVTPLRAWTLRTLLLPVILSTGRFPRGAQAPREVIPDLLASSTLQPGPAVARLGQTARAAASGLRLLAAQTRGKGVVHAYFGLLTPLAALRVLSAHTRHHARALARTRVVRLESA
jgi:hypothetical protein